MFIIWYFSRCCVCMCVCIYIYIYIYTHTHTHTSIYLSHCETYSLFLINYKYAFLSRENNPPANQKDQPIPCSLEDWLFSSQFLLMYRLPVPSLVCSASPSKKGWNEMNPNLVANTSLYLPMSFHSDLLLFHCIWYIASFYKPC